MVEPGRDLADEVVDELQVERARALRQAEVERSLARLGATTERERALVEAASAAIVKKLLHQPIVELKRRGAEEEARDWARAIGELFALSGSGEPLPDRRVQARADAGGAVERSAS